MLKLHPNMRFSQAPLVSSHCFMGTQLFSFSQRTTRRTQAQARVPNWVETGDRQRQPCCVNVSFSLTQSASNVQSTVLAACWSTGAHHGLGYWLRTLWKYVKIRRWMYGRVRSLHGEIPHFGVDENSMGICLGYSSTLDVHGCARLRYQLIARSCRKIEVSLTIESQRFFCTEEWQPCEGTSWSSRCTRIRRCWRVLVIYTSNRIEVKVLVVLIESLYAWFKIIEQYRRHRTESFSLAPK